MISSSILNPRTPDHLPPIPFTSLTHLVPLPFTLSSFFLQSSRHERGTSEWRGDGRRQGDKVKVARWGLGCGWTVRDTPHAFTLPSHVLSGLGVNRVSCRSHLVMSVPPNLVPARYTSVDSVYRSLPSSVRFALRSFHPSSSPPARSLRAGW